MTLDVITAARARTRRRFAVLAAVATVAVAVAVACVAGRHGAGGGAETASAPSTVDAAASATVAAPDPAAALMPPDVTWTRVAGVVLPVSATAGPAQRGGGLASGFAHGLSGAVIAGLHLLVRSTAHVGPAVFEQTITTQVVGEDAGALRASVAAQYSAAAARLGLRYGLPLGDLPAAVAGLRVESAAADQAVLGVLTAAPDRTGATAHAATSVTVVWVEGDWRLVAPPHGVWDAQVHLVDAADLAGYPPLGQV